MSELKEAITYFEQLLHRFEDAPNETYWGKEHNATTRKMIHVALDAMRRAQPEPCEISEYAEDCGECGFCPRAENEPLTLDELRGMVGEPVWMARAKKWVFVSTVVTEPYAQVWYFFKGFVYAVLYYHEKFYRNKPERSEG